MSNCSLETPDSLDQALGLLAEDARQWRIFAGGTDLMVLMNAGLIPGGDFIDIWKLDELRGINEEANTLKIGALTTYSDLIQSELIRRFAPSLADASRTVGAVQIQNRGTIGGNIVNASPAADTLPVLLAYEAVLELRSLRGTRAVPVNEFYTGYRATVLKSDELLVSVRLLKLENFERDFFCKVGTRRAQAISKVVMGAKAKITERRVESISIGVGSVGPTVLKARETEALLTGELLTPERMEQARRALCREVKPITDLRSNEHYRRTISGNVLMKFLRRLRAGSES